MKKLILLFVIVLLVPSVLAITVDLAESYAPSETIIVEIAGNILEPITTEDIELKRVNVNVPFEYDVKRLGEKYFIYLIAPQNENNYTLHINEIITTVDGIVSEIDFTKDFSVSGDIVEYNVKPGLIITQKDFTLDLFLFRDFDQVVSIEPFGDEIILKPGENSVEFEIEAFESGLSFLTLGDYEIPVFAVKDDFILSVLPELRFNPRLIESTILFGTEEIYPISIINDGNEVLEDLELIYDDTVFELDKAFPETMGAQESFEFRLRPLILDRRIEEIIFLRSGEFELEFPVTIDFTENLDEVETPYLEEDFKESQQYSCEEQQGNICTAEEECSGDVKTSSNSASCCTGTCFTPEKEDKGLGLAWIGWVLAILIILVLIVIVLKFRKTRKRGDPLAKMIGAK